jgi:serine/threonine-protein kinase
MRLEMVNPGMVLGGRYRLEERIASGGMGAVWRAVDDVLGRTVAVKILLPELLDEPGFAERFRAEARTMATINHPGVVDVYDYGTDPATGAYLVMEFVQGEALSRTLGRVGRLTAGRTLALVAQAAEALHAAHQAGVVHRDVKPGNLLVRPDGVLVLTDFGIARAAGAAQLTADGSVLGTASYISPEQADGRRATELSDIYALGVVAYQCMAGYRPFEGDNPIEIARRHIYEVPPALPPDVPPVARTILERAMAKRPTDRWPSAAAFAQECRRVAAELGTTAPQPVLASASAGRQSGLAPAVPAPGTRLMPFGGYAGHSGEIVVRPRRRGPSAGTLVAIIVAVVLISVCVGAVIALIESSGSRNNTSSLGAPAASAYVGGTNSGGQGTP